MASGGGGIVVTEATEPTAEVIAAVQRLVPQLSRNAPVPTDAEVSDIVVSPATVLLVARDGDGGEIVGCLTLALFRIPTGLRAWIEDVVVDEGARGRGIGEALSREALVRAQAVGARTVELTSRASRQAANRLYQRIGFHPRDTNVYRYELDARPARPAATDEAGGTVAMQAHDDPEAHMASVKPIPDGYPQVIPYLCVDDANSAIEFYSQVFGATERMRMPAPGGKVGHCELQLGDSVIMLADEFPEMGLKSPRTVGGSPVAMSVYAADVDSVFDKAVQLGATSVQPVENQFYGDRAGRFEDPFGHLWSVATHVEDVAPDEVARRAAEMMGAGGG